MDTAQETVEQPAPDPDVTVVLGEVRNYTIGYYGRRPAHEQAALEAAQKSSGNVAPTAKPIEQQVLLPGLNFVPMSMLRGSKVFDKGHRTNVKLRPVNLSNLDEFSKREIVGMTASSDALSKWYTIEADPEVRRAIMEALKKHSEGKPDDDG